jgi:hypothetical protein
MKTNICILIPLLMLLVLACDNHRPLDSDSENQEISARHHNANAGVNASASAAGNRLIRLRVPEDNPGPPFYARSERPFIYHDGNWAILVFYRNPDQIPANFNLLDFFHMPGPDGPGAFAADLMVSGHILTTDPFANPKQTRFSGNGDVPVWFVPWTVMQELISDDSLTMAELNAADVVKGSAVRFTETLHPHDGHPNPKLVMGGSGALEDGRGFSFNFVGMDHPGEPHKLIHIDIRIE